MCVQIYKSIIYIIRAQTLLYTCMLTQHLHGNPNCVVSIMWDLNFL